MAAGDNGRADDLETSMVLEGFSKAFRKRFQVPADAPSIADRICQRRHHDWIESFRVSHR